MFSDFKPPSLQIIPKSKNRFETENIGVQADDEEECYNVKVQTNEPVEVFTQTDKTTIDLSKIDFPQDKLDRLTSFLENESARVAAELKRSNFNLVSYCLKRHDLFHFL